MTNLKAFLTESMKMTGPYQPAVIKCLLENSGKVSIENIAKFLSASDPKSIDYYCKRLKVYPKQVLKKHGIAEFKDGFFTLRDEVMPSLPEIEELKKICNEKLLSYYDSASLDSAEPSGWGAIRIKMITDQPFCALCGSRPTDTNDIELDIDHIQPKSKGGLDDPEKLQVLCHRWNRGKNNSLLKSAAKAHDSYLNKQEECVFCNMEPERIEYENDYIFMVSDLYPVSDGHRLIMPRRHVASADDLTPIEFLATFKKFQEVTKQLMANDNSISGFNCGYNIGRSAGQTVFHAHYHIIPRRDGDIDQDPRGGIRGVIPDKKSY